MDPVITTVPAPDTEPPSDRFKRIVIVAVLAVLIFGAYVWVHAQRRMQHAVAATKAVQMPHVRALQDSLEQTITMQAQGVATTLIRAQSDSFAQFGRYPAAQTGRLAPGVKVASYMSTGRSYDLVLEGRGQAPTGVEITSSGWKRLIGVQSTTVRGTIEALVRCEIAALNDAPASGGCVPASQYVPAK